MKQSTTSKRTMRSSNYSALTAATVAKRKPSIKKKSSNVDVVSRNSMSGLDSSMHNSTLLGQIPYAGASSHNLTELAIGGHFLSETECKSIEEAVTKEVLSSLNLSRQYKTTGSKQVEKLIVPKPPRRMQNTKGSNIRIMSFKELRKLEKAAAQSRVGPGTYDLPQNKLQNITFGRRTNQQSDQTPGPGQYMGEDAAQSTKYVSLSTTLKGKSRERKPDCVIGPGEYNQHFYSFGEDALKWSMGRKSSMGPVNKNPAPNVYNVDKAFRRTQSTNYFATLKAKYSKVSEERRIREISPGPAMYTLRNTFGRDVTQISLAGKQKWRPLNINPGPGSYAPNYSSQIQRTLYSKIGNKSERFYVKRSKTPPVGQYSPYKRLGSDAIGGNIGIRMKWKPLNNNPPPGAYDPQPEVTMHRSRSAVDISKFSYGPRIKFQETATCLISSAEYNIQKPFGADVKFKTMGGKHKFRPLNYNPAPTDYKPSLKGTQPNLTNLITCKSARVFHPKNNNPEAGMYQRMEKFGKNGLKYSFGSRIDRGPANRNPSPVAYDPSYKLVQPSAPGMVMRPDQMVFVDVSRFNL